ncbi:NLP/P60 [Sporomusaceae bacterium FL31]|nr:NLP/P60 [Sporomusaceae bacterium FL31]GCE32653.1 NLP/P60 [Sporomusaceae bacterium]
MNRVTRILVILLMLVCTVSITYASAFEQGDQGQDVVAIQARLNTLGYEIVADGDYGPATVNAVKAFQRDRGLESDGVIGSQTYRALMGREIPTSRDGSSVSVRRLTQTSFRYIGVPYMFGGTTPNGFDCSGFVQFVFGNNGISLPRTADQQFEMGQPVSYSRLQPGDLVFFSTYASGPSHSGIYLGDGKFISATSSRGVAVDLMESRYWGSRYVGARRVL